MKLLLLFIFCVNSFVIFSQKNITELIKHKHETSPIDAIIYADSILNSKHNLPDSVIISLEHFKALSYLVTGNNMKSIELYSRLRPKINKTSKQYVKLLLNMSSANIELSNYTEGTSEALEAMEVAKKYNYISLIGSAHNSLSFIYFKNNDFDKSFEYLQLSAEMYLEQQDSIKLATTYNNIAIVFNRQNNYEQTLLYNKKALKISTLIKDWIGKGKSYSNIGRVFELKNDFNTAIKYYKLAIANNTKHNIVNSIPYRNLGDAYFELIDYEKTNTYYNIALEIEASNNNQSVVQKLYNSLLKTAIKQKAFKNALVYQHKVDSLNSLRIEHINKESIKMLENQKKLIKNQSELEFQKEELKQEQEINFKNKLIFGGIVISIVLLFLFLYQRIKNSKLIASKEKLIMEQKVLRSQMNPHFIFNALSAIQNSLLDNDPIKSATYLARFAKLIRQNFDFISQNRILLSEEIDALKNYLDTQKMRFEDKFDYKIEIGERVDINSIEIPPLLLQPFVENSIEHGFKKIKTKGLISVIIFEKNSKICFNISDNGIGYEKKRKEDKLHSIDVFKKRLNLIGNKDEESFVIKSDTQGTVIKFCLTYD